MGAEIEYTHETEQQVRQSRLLPEPGQTRPSAGFCPNTGFSYSPTHPQPSIHRGTSATSTRSSSTDSLSSTCCRHHRATPEHHRCLELSGCTSSSCIGGPGACSYRFTSNTSQPRRR